jgi:hypothetical protein
MALISSNLLLEMIIIFVYPIIILRVELRGRLKILIMPNVRGQKECMRIVLTRSSVVVMFLPQTGQEVNQQRVGPSDNNSFRGVEALLLQLRRVWSMDMEQSSSEEHFTGADLCHAQDNQTVSLADT